jgi:hypothetical protein
MFTLRAELSRARMFTVKQHLLSRGLDPRLYHCVIDESERVATFSLFNISGQYVGYQVYRPDSHSKKNNCPREGRYFTYLPAQTDGVFGLERNTGKGPLFIVEGVFKAVALHNMGFDAIAVLTSHPKRMKPWFRILCATRPLIGIGDGDDAGKKLVATIGRGACSPKDLDEMTPEEIQEFSQRYAKASDDVNRKLMSGTTVVYWDNWA